MTKKIKELTVKENLNKARKKAHETMRKNGHYRMMAEYSASARRKKKLSTQQIAKSV